MTVKHNKFDAISTQLHVLTSWDHHHLSFRTLKKNI